MLPTSIKHINTDQEFQQTLNENENVMVVCGRAGPMCIPVYDIQENLERKYDDVAFRVINFDGPASHNIKSLPQVRSFTGLPFTVYFKNGEVASATSSIQTKGQVKEILDREFGRQTKAA
jgi:thioredoxin 1